MSQTDLTTSDKKGWWERLVESLTARKDDAYEVPEDSLFSNAWNGAGQTVADVPDKVKQQIREEAILDTVGRLEQSLRLLLYATTPGKEPPSPERYQQILNVLRYELEHRIHLVPDTYCGAVQKYEPSMDEGYTIDGRCQIGDLLRIRVPCWRMYERIVIRGEAELVEPEEETKPATAAAPVDVPSPVAAPPGSPSDLLRELEAAHAAQGSPAETEPATAQVEPVAEAAPAEADAPAPAVELGESAAAEPTVEKTADEE
jgi:hypothetical protein